MPIEREIDEDERREAIMERRARNSAYCKCGYPDWPGQCPGWRQCPVHGETPEGENDASL